MPSLSSSASPHAIRVKWRAGPDGWGIIKKGNRVDHDKHARRAFACQRKETTEGVWRLIFFSRSFESRPVMCEYKQLLIGAAFPFFFPLFFVVAPSSRYYGSTIIQAAGLRDKSTVIWAAAGASAISFLASLVGLYLVEKIGRRPLTLLSLLGTCPDS